jgi:glycosyltransferase 2 family protein
MTQAASKSKWGWLRWLPGVLISLVAIYILFRSVDWQNLGNAFKNLNLLILLIIIPLFFISMFFRTLEWRIVSGSKDTFWNMFLWLNVGYMANNILPFRVGEIVRAMFFGQSSNTGMFYGLSTIIIERVFDVGIAALLLFVSIPHIIGAAWAQMTSYIAMGLVVTALVFLAVLAYNRNAVKKWFEGLSAKSPFLQKHVQSRLASLLDGLKALTNWKIFLSSFLLLVMAWAIGLLEYMIVMRSFIPGASIWWGVFSLGVLAMGIAIPSAPANIGVFEAAVVAALSVVGVDPAKSLAFAIFVHFFHIIFQSLIGVIGVLKQGKSLEYWLASLFPGKTGEMKE